MTVPDPTSPVVQPARSSRFARVRAATDRVPTRWFAGIGTALFLAATAAFGGLTTVSASDVPRLEAGQTHTNDRLALTPQRAVLLDTFPEAGASADPDAGERVLAVLVDAENRWNRADRVDSQNGVSSTLEIEGLQSTPPTSVARYDDATRGVWLQPGVMATLVFTWIVPDDLFADGDEVSVTLLDQTLLTGSFVVDGDYWGEPRPGAVVSLTAEDRGDGS